MSEKILIINAGLKGGTGKTSQLALIHFWYQSKYGINPRCFDLDPGGTFSSLVGAQWPYSKDSTEPSYEMEGIVSSILTDEENSVFLVDLPSSSADKAKDTFLNIPWHELEFADVNVVLLGNLTADTETMPLWKSWKSLFETLSEDGFSAVGIGNKMKGELTTELQKELGHESLYYPIIEEPDIFKNITQKKYGIGHIFLPYAKEVLSFIKGTTESKVEAKALRKEVTSQKEILFDGIKSFNLLNAAKINNEIDKYMLALTNNLEEVLLPEGTKRISQKDYYAFLNKALYFTSATNCQDPDIQSEIDSVLSNYVLTLDLSVPDIYNLSPNKQGVVSQA